MKRDALPDPLELFKPKRALLLGDLMVDIYTRGEAGRISPEAPVLILQVQEESLRPGGAGNAILNMVSLGMQVKAMGRVGKDAEGAELVGLLEAEGVSVDHIVVDSHFRTPVKRRIIADSQQLLRVDYEQPSPIGEKLEREVIASIEEAMSDVDVVAISDYAKGFLSPAILSHAIGAARARGLGVIVDPKGRDFFRYKGATLIKPNLQEAIQASGLDKSAPLADIAGKILKETEIEMLMVTRSKEGISLFHKSGTQEDFPAKIREVRDVTGAGDTVFAIIAQAHANQVDLQTSVLLANVAAGIAIERFGCARITLKELQERLLHY